MSTGTPPAPAGAPPLRRDRLVQGWLLVKGVADAGDTAWTIALAWTAVQLASPATAGVVVAAGTVPRAVVLLFGGVIADRFDARRVMALTTVARLAVLGVAVGVDLTHGATVPLLFTVAVAFGACDAVFEPSAATVGRQLVEEEDLAAYMGIGQTASRLGTMLGAAAGGGLVALGGLAASGVANLATYAVLLGFVTLGLALRFPLPRAPRQPVLRSIADGFGYLGADARVRTLVLVLSGLNLAVTPALGLGLALRVDRAGWGPAMLGGLELTTGVGAVIGATVAIRWRPANEVTAGFLLLALQGVSIVLLALPVLPVALAMCLLIGVTAGSASAFLSAVFARTVSGEHFGRVISIQRLGDDVLMPAAMAAFGAIAGGASLAAAFLLFGGTMAVLMVVALVRPTVRLLGEAQTTTATPASAR